MDALRWALVARSRDPDADLRARIDAAVALGPLGDPRFERRTGPLGDYLLPPMVELPGGLVRIGSDEPYGYLGEPSTVCAPEHEVVLAPYALGQYAVTNAEYACFVASGGYEDPRWWPTAAAEAWRDGSNTAAGRRLEMLAIWERFVAQPDMLDEMHQDGRMRQRTYELWRGHITLSRDAFSAYLAERFPNRRWTWPKGWSGPHPDQALHPVTGISWFEARAYCLWLSAQTGSAFRLPTEAEFEAATRRRQGDLPPLDRHGMPCYNCAGAHISDKAPVGVFPCSDTADGLVDMTGNTMTWTSTLWGQAAMTCDWLYPYEAGDGREAPDAPAAWARAIRGGYFAGVAPTWERHGAPQDLREDSVGLRLAR